MISGLAVAGVSLLSLTLIQTMATPVNAATYYVSPTGNDANAGTQSTPWKTIGKAARTLVAGDTAILMDGTYTEPSIVFSNSGTAAMPITVRAQNKHRAILSSTSGCNANISIQASYVTIQDIRSAISPSNVACSPVNSNSGTGVRCWNSGTVSTSNPSSGYVGCAIRGVLFDASAARGHAVKTHQDFSVVEDCLAYSGIEAFNSYGTVFRNNVVIGGDAWGSSLVAKGGVRNFQAYNNVVRIRNTYGVGLALGGITGTQWLYDPSSGVEAYNSVAYNNVVINESGGSSTLDLGMMGARDSSLFNNVVVSGRLYLRQGYTPTESTNPTVKNNIFYCSGGNVIAQWTYSGTLNYDYNNFYNCSGAPGQSHPIIGNPLFVDSRADWHLLSGSPAVGTGTVMAATGFRGEALVVNRDKDGNQRSIPWDLGIYATNGSASDTTPPATPTNLRVS